MLNNRIVNSRFFALLLLIGLGLTQTSLLAQRADNRSPYSRFGYGTLRKSLTAGTRALGGASTAIRDHYITNPANPASYSAVDSMTFIMDLGISGQYSRFTEGGKSDSRWLGNLDYFTILFPLGKKMGMSLGIMPWATTGYRFGSQETMSGDKVLDKKTYEDQFLRSYSGKGSYQKLYVGLSSAHIKGLSLGLNGSFLFGKTTLQRNVNYPNGTALKLESSESLTLRGGSLDVGVQYEMALDSLGHKTLVFGAVFTPEVKLFPEHQRIDFSQEGEKRTDLENHYNLPLSASLGLSYQELGKWRIATDLSFTKWKGTNFDNLRAEFDNRFVWALGTSWTPNERARSFFKRSTYSLGLNLANSYLKYPYQEKGGKESFAGYHELGANIGIAMPMVDQRSSLNLGFEYKYLRPKNSGMVSEHYFGLNLGITFNEGWFRKARVN